MTADTKCDVLVVGSGNAGCSAAVAAKQAGAGRVVLIDKCPREWAGGNGFFTAGAFRTAHGGLQDLLPIVNNVDDRLAELTDLEAYPPEKFKEDLVRVTKGRCDPRLSKALIEASNETIKWLASSGIRFQLSYNRQAYEFNGRYKFWGGLALKTQDGGKGLIDDHLAAAARHGVEVWFSTAAKKIETSPTTGRISGMIIEREGQLARIETNAIVLAAGGFEANSRMRAQYLGPSWDLGHVRGTPYNTGECLEMAVRDVGAATTGNWSGCHSVAWDANAPHDGGDRAISNEFTKSGYPLGVMLNVKGERFVDEGVDLRNFTYARFGKAILAQPNGLAFQIWDAQMTPLLRAEEYRPERVKHITAASLDELAEKCAAEGLEDKARFVQTLTDYNAATRRFKQEHPNIVWNPAVKDGMSTQSSSATGLPLPKSNWATPIEQPPFLAVKVACGVTFTFGGLAIEPDNAAVLSASTARQIPGLFCAGEMVGGLFYDNYPGGSGLTAGAVFGRRAGTAAAAVAADAAVAGGSVARLGDGDGDGDGKRNGLRPLRVRL